MFNLGYFLSSQFSKQSWFRKLIAYSVANARVVMDNKTVGKVLDAVDERTLLQERLHDLVSDGFMWLSRERYRDALATHRT